MPSVQQAGFVEHVEVVIGNLGDAKMSLLQLPVQVAVDVQVRHLPGRGHDLDA